MAEREATPLWPPIEPPLTAPGWLGQAMELVDRLTENAFQRGLDGDHDPYGRQQSDLREHLRLRLMERDGAPLKDHVLREVVNTVTEVAREFHGTQQLRERLRRAMEPLITAACGTPADGPQRERAKSVKFRCQYGPQDEGSAEYDSWFPGRSTPADASEPLGRGIPIPVSRFAAPCESCHGTGQNPAWPLAVCPQCEGTGKSPASAAS